MAAIDTKGTRDMTSSGPPDAAGIVTKDSPRTITDTVSRLTDLIHDRGMNIFAVIDQSAEAHEIGLELRPTVLVIFGNPRSGTAVMEAAPLAALDLPLKILVWADQDRTSVSYLSPGALADRYALDPELAGNLAGIEPLTDALVGP
jgi:uncharacterized protein (DUF302 family)